MSIGIEKTLALLSMSGVALAANGWSYSTGPVASGSFIREATSTLVVPEGQDPLSGHLSLWVGMGTDVGHLIQTILDRHPGGGGTICEDIKDVQDWCAYAYTLARDDQIFGGQVSVKAGDQLEYRYVYNDETAQYDQYAVLNGEVRSTLSTESGKGLGWGSAIECAADDCGLSKAHRWINTRLVLDVADANYGNTVAQNGVTSSGFTTEDGGKTWKVDRIEVPDFQFVRP